MDEQKLQTLNRLLGAMDTKAMSSDEITKNFEAIIKHVEEVKKVTAKEVKAIRTLYEKIQAEQKSAIRDYGNEFDALQSKLLATVEKKLSTLKNGKDGAKGANGEKGADGKTIIKEITKETLMHVDSATIAYFEDEINKLKDKIKEVDSKPRGGGGTSAIGVAQTFKWIAHTEQPVGVIDGVNTTYTVKNVIWWVAGFTLNGEQVAELPNFTYINRTITFASALPADYSGSDFECKYIGT